MTVGRVPRQAPADLTFSLDHDLVESWAGQERDWLAADRRAAYERWQELDDWVGEMRAGAPVALAGAAAD